MYKFTTETYHIILVVSEHARGENKEPLLPVLPLTSSFM